MSPRTQLVGVTLPHSWSLVKYILCATCISCVESLGYRMLFRLDALALSVIAMATWLAGWLAGCLSQPVLYQND